MSSCVTIRTVPHVTGEKEFVKTLVTETTGENINSAVIKLGYKEYNSGYPTSFADPDFSSAPAVNQRIVGLLVTDTIPVGEYMLWVEIADSPENIIRPGGRFNVV